MIDVYTLPVLISMAIFLFTTHITPGPTNIILLSSVINVGYRKSLPFMIGCIISYPLMMILTGLGISIVFEKFPFIVTSIKVLGILYLCLIAYKIANDSVEYDSIDNEYKGVSFLDAFIYTLLNPKAWIVYSSTISLFVTSVENNIIQVFIIVLITFISMLITVYFWAIGGIILKKYLGNKKLIKRINTFMAILLVLSIIPIIK